MIDLIDWACSCEQMRPSFEAVKPCDAEDCITDLRHTKYECYPKPPGKSRRPYIAVAYVMTLSAFALGD